MRLTLRTLLAYMDDILDPVDQDDLARQVAESETASELIHRTRDATRRLRLGAPPVIGEGMELDPNCVAEYLDNTMSAEDMTEFQQVCLDSDVHLAEVASCHHILTMVLGEPAEIDPAMREQMYQIPGKVDEWHKLRLDGPHRAADAVEAAPTMAQHESGEDEPITEVPDYLKASESSTFGRLALAFAAALLLGFGAFMLFGPGGLLADKQQVAEGDGANETPEIIEPIDLTPDETAETDDSTLPALGSDADQLLGTPPPAVAAGTPQGDSVDGSEAATTADPTGDDAEGLPAIADSPDDSGAGVITEPLAVEGDNANSAAMADASPVETPIEVVAAEAESVDTQDAAVADASTPVDDGMSDEAVPTTDNNTTGPDERVALNTTAGAATDSAAMEVDATLDPPADAPLGTLVATRELLLRWNDLDGQWLRLPARSGVSAGNHLLSLPTYRPSLALVSGLRVEMCGAANATFELAEDGTTPRLEVGYGQFLLHNTDMDSIEVEVAVGGETKRLLLEARAVLGLDVDRPFVAGADVESSVGKFVATFYAPNGNVTWNVASNPLPVVSPSQWAWNDVAASSLTDDVSWLDGQSLDYLLQNVSRKFEEGFDANRPARVQLLELYETSRRREEKALAAQSGTHVGQFVPFVQALADTQQQSNWDEHIATLRSAMSRSTLAAKQVHETLTQQRGADLADDLFAMLRGYTQQQIGPTRDAVATGVTRQLIDWLAHDRLEYRVLAIYNLKEIYGGKTLGYNPVVSEPSRQERAVRTWRARLADNELVPTYLQ